MPFIPGAAAIAAVALANPITTVCIIGASAVAVAPAAVVGLVLYPIGFGSAGPIAGSLAAASQGPAVAAGSGFAIAQSIAMGGAAAAAVGKAAAVVGGVAVGVLGAGVAMAGA